MTDRRVTRGLSKASSEASDEQPQTSSQPQNLEQAIIPLGTQSYIQAGSNLVFIDPDGRFNTLAEFAIFLKEEKDESTRYSAFKYQVERLNDVSEVAERWAEYLSDMKKNLGLETQKEDETLFKDLEERASRSRTTAGRISSARIVVGNVWGPDIQLFISNAPNSSQFWRKLQTLATAASKKDVTFKKVMMLINLSTLTRIQSGKKGVSTQMSLQTADVDLAIEAVRSGDIPDAVTFRVTIQGAGYGVNQDGLLCNAEDAAPFTIEEAAEDEDMTDEGFPSPGLENRTKRIREESETGDDEDEDDDNLDSIDDYADRADKDYEEGGQGFDEVDTQGEEKEDETPEGDAADEEPPAKARKASDGKKVAVVKKKTCGCDITVSSTYIRQFKKGYRPTAIQHSSIVKTWMKYKDNTCHKHDALILSSLGMKSKGVNKTQAKERLTAFNEATIHSTLGDMKTDTKTYHWFRRSHRPVRVDDALGPYKYRHETSGAYRLTDAQQADLCEYAGIDRDDWKKTGSVNVDCFGWWKKEKFDGVAIYDVAMQEFDMYDHHLRLIDEKSNYGWLRTMFHSLAQQAMRQDPLYWMMYAALREDRNADLVSYPYYAKYQKKGDWTYFRHIDINIPDLAKAGRGAYQIQGTVSLDEERKDDCTEIVPGMHRYIQEWAKELETREGVKLGGLVNAIDDKVFSNEDKKKYKTDWKAVPCKALQVRISQPHLPHGAQGPAKGVRRTMLPWFVTVQADGNHLEVLESGTWDDLAKAHRELTSAPRTPSGLANRYGDIPYAFPAAVPLTGLGALSDSIVCRYKPNNPMVMHVKKQLVEGDKQFRDAYLKQWRQDTTKAVVEAFRVVRALEKDTFKGKSYFNKKEEGLQSASADEMPEGENAYHFDSHGARDEDAKRLAREDSPKGSSDEEDSDGEEGGATVRAS